jgi:acetylornithine deacetylase
MQDAICHAMTPTATTMGASFWMDAAFLAAACVSTLAFGPHGAGTHAIDELVDLNSVEHCRETLDRFIRSFSGAAAHRGHRCQTCSQ